MKFDPGIHEGNNDLMNFPPVPLWGFDFVLLWILVKAFKVLNDHKANFIIVLWLMMSIPSPSHVNIYWMDWNEIWSKHWWFSGDMFIMTLELPEKPVAPKWNGLTNTVCTALFFPFCQIFCRFFHQDKMCILSRWHYQNTVFQSPLYSSFAFYAKRLAVLTHGTNSNPGNHHLLQKHLVNTVMSNISMLPSWH